MCLPYPVVVIFYCYTTTPTTAMVFENMYILVSYSAQTQKWKKKKTFLMPIYIFIWIGFFVSPWDPRVTREIPDMYFGIPLRPCRLLKKYSLKHSLILAGWCNVVGISCPSGEEVLSFLLVVWSSTHVLYCIGC